MRRVLAFLILSLLLLMPSALAHPGRTDSIGGHYDNSTGLYHFHHGYSAHHHPGGVCPYDSSRTYPTDKPSRATQTTRPSTSSSSSSLLTRSYTASTRAPTAKPSPTPAPKTKMSNTDSAVFVLGTMGLTIIGIIVHAIRKDRKERNYHPSNIMEAKPGEIIKPPKSAPPPVAMPPSAPTPAPAPPALVLLPPTAPTKVIAVAAADPTLSMVSIVCGYHLKMDFSNGETRYYDAVFLLLEDAYSALADYSLFQDFHISVSHLLLYWDHFSITISAKRLYMESQSTPTVTVTDKTYPDYSGLKVCYRKVQP